MAYPASIHAQFRGLKRRFPVAESDISARAGGSSALRACRLRGLRRAGVRGEGVWAAGRGWAAATPAASGVAGGAGGVDEAAARKGVTNRRRLESNRQTSGLKRYRVRLV